MDNPWYATLFQLPELAETLKYLFSLCSLYKQAYGFTAEQIAAVPGPIVIFPLRPRMFRGAPPDSWTNHPDWNALDCKLCVYWRIVRHLLSSIRAGATR